MRSKFHDLTFVIETPKSSVVIYFIDQISVQTALHGYHTSIPEVVVSYNCFTFFCFRSTLTFIDAKIEAVA